MTYGNFDFWWFEFRHSVKCFYWDANVWILALVLCCHATFKEKNVYHSVIKKYQTFIQIQDVWILDLVLCCHATFKEKNAYHSVIKKKCQTFSLIHDYLKNSYHHEWYYVLKIILCFSQILLASWIEIFYCQLTM